MNQQNAEISIEKDDQGWRWVYTYHHIRIVHGDYEDDLETVASGVVARAGSEGTGVPVFLDGKPVTLLMNTDGEVVLG